MDLQTSIYRYCNYQDRCQQEIRDKLYSLGASTPETENLIAELIETNLLNEERFARSFARGKFRIKHWGRVKIVQHLKQHRISPYCIQKGLTEIDAEEYYRTLTRLVELKWHELSAERSIITRKGKTFRFLQQRGFESALIAEALSEVMNAEQK